MKITTWTVQATRTIKKLVTPKISRRKGTLSKKVYFPENPTALTTFEQSPTQHHFLMQHRFFNPTIGKPTAPAYQNTLTCYQYLLISMSKMHMNIVYWNSRHPKKAILPTFSGPTPHFQSEKQKTRSKNLHHRKAESVAGFF